jgi:hypothetical protein
VGVFLNCQNGFISFFNVNDWSLICTQKLKFKGLLRPYIHLQKETVNPIFVSPWDKEFFFWKNSHTPRYRQLSAPLHRCVAPGVLFSGNHTSHSQDIDVFLLVL